jgi:hypothetical protein
VQVETDALGFEDTDAKMLIPVARKLLIIKYRFSIGDAATYKVSNKRPPMKMECCGDSAAVNSSLST